MADARFVPDFSGYNDVLNSPEMQSVLDGYAERIKRRATSMLSPDWGSPPREDHFVSGEFPTRVGSTGRYVRTNTEHSKLSQSKNKTLTKAFNAERG